jgi:hypothetical protein
VALLRVGIDASHHADGASDVRSRIDRKVEKHTNDGRVAPPLVHETHHEVPTWQVGMALTRESCRLVAATCRSNEELKQSGGSNVKLQRLFFSLRHILRPLSE